jgi:ureidoacrylate peracid hydrolase
MSANGLPQEVLDEAVERRGTLHALADFDPSRCALVVIDMQNFFMDMMPDALGLVPNINRLARSVRLSGGQVVWVSMTLDESDRTQWSHFFDRLLNDFWRDAHINSLAKDSDGWQLQSGLETREEDWHVEKSRFSAFIPGSSDLEARLRERGIETLLIAGTATNVCCESTARDAMMLNFATILISDACATTDEAAHNATLANFQVIFGDVLSVDEVLAGIDQTVQVDYASLRNI